jgi:hypothetical protein
VAKILYAPFGIVSSLLAGFAARKLFDSAWGHFDDSDGPPEPGERDAPAVKVVAGAVVQAGVFAGVRALFDRYGRRVFNWLFGVWPGKSPTA